MKPDWKDAPGWAKYLAMDENGEWYWHEYDPFLVGPFWMNLWGRYKYCDNKPHWTETKEARPVVPTKESSPC